MSDSIRNARRKNCPVCGKPSDEKHRPFCSDRCRKVDLGRWLTGAYAVPGEPIGDGAGEEDEETHS